MTQQPVLTTVIPSSNSGRNEEVVDTSPASEKSVCANITQTTIGNKPDAGILFSTHKITKVVNRKSFYLTCNECNTSYRSIKQVLDDHPGYDTENIIIFQNSQRRIIF